MTMIWSKTPIHRMTLSTPKIVQDTGASFLVTDGGVKLEPVASEAGSPAVICFLPHISTTASSAAFMMCG